MSEITRSDQMYPTRGKDTVIYNNVVYPAEILFHDDQLIYNDGRSTVAQVRLELTSKSLILRRIRDVHISTEFNEHRRRFVTLARDPKTKSFGFSIKGGSDTGNVETKPSNELHPHPRNSCLDLRGDTEYLRTASCW